ncbi:MAG TPA: FHA domain-containing protein [Solirubrobacterales bacterium]|nr:FHA domain-containing protein [Solirubrobacterales bacterium]
MSSIFDSAGIGSAGGACAAGNVPGEGTYFCLVCGSQLSLRETDPLPECPRCGGSRFRRDSIFASRQEHGSTTVEFAFPREPEPPGWLDEARGQLSGSGYYLALRDRGKVFTFALADGWSRIGRCGTADVCLDDPSVSRRHAMVCAEAGESPRILDDRSLNGVLVNGEKIDVAELEPGDELAIGRYRLYLLQA